MRLVNRKLINKLILSYMIIIITPILILGYYSYSNLVDNTKKNYKTESILRLKSVDKILQTYFEELKRVTSNAFLSEDIQKMMDSDNTDNWLELENQRLFNKVRVGLIGDRENVDKVMLICDNGSTYGDTSDMIIGYNIRNEDWYNEINGSNSEFIIIGPHKRKYTNLYSNTYLITVGRRIKDLNSGKAKAVFLIELRFDILNRLLKEFCTNGRKIVVTDKHDMIVFDNNPLNISKSVESVYQDINPGMVSRKGDAIDYGNYLAVGLKGQMTSWNYTELTERDTLFKQINGFAYNIVLIGLVCFTLFLILSAYLALGISKPLNALKDSMKRVSNGNFNEKINLKNLEQIGEIYDLSWSFNSMVEEIQRLITKVYETQIKKINSDFKALQAQINPHFLYNTLESINCLAQLREAEDVSEMVRSLARVFRYSIKNNNEFVTLDDELNHVKDYILLQTVRYDDKFETIYSVPKHMLAMKVIKFSLQPLVENAIYHGIEKSPDKGIIEISAATDGCKLIVTVSNNGVLIKKERLEEIRDLLDSDIKDLTEYEQKTGTIGIYNIQMRIRLNFGTDYGLSIKSDKENGTVVKLMFPYSAGEI